MRVKLVILLLLGFSFIVHSDANYLKRFTFDEEKPLKKWKKMILNGEVDYALIKSGDDGYIQALSNKTCSALYYRVGYNLKKFPLLSWKWKVLEFPDKSDAETKEEKDDYAARVYVIFPFLTFGSSRFLEYVWSEDLPLGTILDSPAGKNVKIMVIQSGRAETDQEWISESRNVYQDYTKAFGQSPRRGVGAVAIMCDADNTKTKAEALFDEINIASQIQEGI
jgi:hypothetical protein